MLSKIGQLKTISGKENGASILHNKRIRKLYFSPIMLDFRTSFAGSENHWDAFRLKSTQERLHQSKRIILVPNEGAIQIRENSDSGSA